MRKLLSIFIISLFLISCNKSEFNKVEYNSDKEVMDSSIKSLKNGALIFGDSNNENIMTLATELKKQNNDDKVYIIDIPEKNVQITDNLIKNNAIGSVNIIKDGFINKSFIIKKDDNIASAVYNYKLIKSSSSKMPLNSNNLKAFSEIIDLTNIKPENNDDSKDYLKDLTSEIEKGNAETKDYIKKYNNSNFKAYEPDLSNSDYNYGNELYSKELFNSMENTNTITLGDMTLNVTGKHKEIFTLSNSFDIRDKNNKVIFSDSTKLGGFDFMNDEYSRYSYININNKGENKALYYYIIDKMENIVYKSNSYIDSTENNIYFANHYGYGVYTKDKEKFYTLATYNTSKEFPNIELQSNMNFNNGKMNVQFTSYASLSYLLNVEYNIDDLKKYELINEKTFFDNEVIGFTSNYASEDGRETSECQSIDVTGDYMVEQVCMLYNIELNEDETETGFKNNVAFKIMDKNNQTLYISDEIAYISHRYKLSSVTDIDGDGIKEIAVTADMSGSREYTMVYKYNKKTKKYDFFDYDPEKKNLAKVTVKFEDNYIISFEKDNKVLTTIDVSKNLYPRFFGTYKENLIKNNYFDKNGKVIIKSKPLSELKIGYTTVDMIDGQLVSFISIGLNDNGYMDADQFSNIEITYNHNLEVESIKNNDEN